MADQPSYTPLEPNTFFPDGRSGRPLVPGTVARGHLRLDRELYTGMKRGQGPQPDRDWQRAGAVIGMGGWGVLGPLGLAVEDTADVDAFPIEITKDVMKRGQERYTIFCTPCHDARGTGHGKIVERGYTMPPTYHSDRLRKAPVGHFFRVVTEGYGSMPDYREQIPVRDRWAIIAYIRALQASPVGEGPQVAANAAQGQPGGGGR
jgi:hypothetical protein